MKDPPLLSRTPPEEQPGSAVVGTLIIQAREIAKGRTPRPFTPQLVGEGILQAGMFGIWADLMFTDPTKFGGLPGTLAGPTVGSMANVSKIIWGSYEEAMDGGKWFADELLPKTVSAATKMAFPLQTWYSRIAAERGLLNHVNQAANPNWDKDQRRYKRWLKGRGQELLD